MLYLFMNSPFRIPRIIQAVRITLSIGNCLVFCLTLQLACADAAFGDGLERKISLSEFQRGMTIPLVIRAIGPVDEKMEYETSRKERWFYPGAQLMFHEGELQDWIGVDANGISVASSMKTQSQETSESAEVSETRVSPETEAILLEILKEVPSSPDSPSSVAASPMPPTSGQPVLNNSAPMLHDTGMRRIEPIELDDVED